MTISEKVNSLLGLPVSEGIVMDETRAKRELTKMMVRATKMVFGVQVKRTKSDEWSVAGGPLVGLEDAAKALVAAYDPSKLL